jgi:predicted ArsR family transcriptional regulator
MHSTKTEILAQLKRGHGATVDELSSSLGLASMTVRQHLTALERDGAVQAQEVRRPNGGRPHFLYTLTDEGHRRVSAGYDRLVQLLVAEAGSLNGDASTHPDARRRELFRRAAESLAERHRSEVAALSGGDRAARLTAILRDHGGFAEWHEDPDGVELLDFNCVFRAMVSAAGPCDWHEPFLASILGTPVEPAPRTACNDCCRYIIPAARAADVATGRDA